LPYSEPLPLLPAANTGIHMKDAVSTPIDPREERELPFSARPTGRTDRSWIGWLLLTLALVLVVLMALSPSAYVIEQPGPVYDTLGETEHAGENVPLIDVPGQKTYPTKGTLDLLTVSVVGTPAAPPDLLQVALAWFDPSKSVQPLSAIYPSGTTSEQRDDESRLQMENSQQEAIAAALTELGYDIPRTLSVQSLLDGSPAAGELKQGDRITSINGQEATDLPRLRELVAANGTGHEATIGFVRDGTAGTIRVTPYERNGAVVVGVGIAVSYDLPFQVDIQLENVGGPSAGMMFALGLYDKLTPGALTGGARVAGTGTIDAQGAVGAIGGIRQKLHGAQRAGARWFLAPQSNCDEVVGHVPDGVNVIAVATLDDALAALKAIADGVDPSGLPPCRAG
jgi:PDZ domain-containing protein